MTCVHLSLHSQADFETETFHKLIELKQAMYVREYPGPCPCQFGNLVLQFSNFTQWEHFNDWCLDDMNTHKVYIHKILECCTYSKFLCYFLFSLERHQLYPQWVSAELNSLQAVGTVFKKTHENEKRNLMMFCTSFLIQNSGFLIRIKLMAHNAVLFKSLHLFDQK